MRRQSALDPLGDVRSSAVSEDLSLQSRKAPEWSVKKKALYSVVSIIYPNPLPQVWDIMNQGKSVQTRIETLMNKCKAKSS